MSRNPVHIRRNVESFTDPYIDQQSPEEYTVCRSCGSVYTAGRWYDPERIPIKAIPQDKRHEVMCPACQKTRDRMPGGVLKITGDFVQRHKDEILNLIRNETGKAYSVNPLERIISFEAADAGQIEITTTNEKLAQRIGRALHKAYSGEVRYKWSADTKLVRVNWHREV